MSERSERFDRFFTRLVDVEKGYVDDRDDSGGETNLGISSKEYPNEDIKNMTLARAKELYRRDYYSTMGIDEIEDEKLAWQVFDFGVNAGVPRAIFSVTRKYDYSDYVNYVGERVKYYLDLSIRKPKNKKFLKGWVLRAVEL